MATDDSCEDTGQIVERLDLVQFAGLDEGGEHGPVLCTGVVTSKERIRSLLCDGGLNFVGQLGQLTTRMRPAAGQLNRLIIPQIKHAVAPGVAVDLQDATEALQNI